MTSSVINKSTDAQKTVRDLLNTYMSTYMSMSICICLCLYIVMSIYSYVYIQLCLYIYIYTKRKKATVSAKMVISDC